MLHESVIIILFCFLWPAAQYPAGLPGQQHRAGGEGPATLPVSRPAQGQGRPARHSGTDTTYQA